MGARDHPLHNIWRQMRKRCYSRSNKDYRWYGAKGIKVCERWNEYGVGFWNFVEDMGPRPDGYTLDRIDSSQDYRPGNCQWASQKDQARNRCNNIWIEYEGKKMVLADWAREINKPYQQMLKQYHQGCSPEKILDPEFWVQSKKDIWVRENYPKMLNLKEKGLSQSQIAKELGTTQTRVSNTLRIYGPKLDL